MSNEEMDTKQNPGQDALDGEGIDSEGNDSLLKEFWTFLMENKIWWITPTVVILLLVLGFIMVSRYTDGGAVAPFISTLF